jgi:hypothetical protein
MKWKKSIRSRRGSYIVEAVMVLPIFIISVIMLMSLIPIMGTCENIAFSTADELRLEAVKSAFRKNPAALPVSVQARIEKENPWVSDCRIKAYRYFYSDEEAGIEDLISLRLRVTFAQRAPIGVFDDVVFDGQVTCRAFTGKLHTTPPDRGEQDDPLVCIFPEWGKKYHGKACSYVRAACQMTYLSQEIKNGFAPCKLCNASQAQVGSPVFCFSQSGRAYHLADCRTVDRYYTEVVVSSAASKGYTPCSKCGGR